MNNDVQLIQALNDNPMLKGVYLMKYDNATARCIPFELSFMDYLHLNSIDKCSVTGKSLQHTKMAGNEHRFSIDRVDPFGPYSMKNCVVMSVQVNGIKAKLDSFIQDTYLTDEQKLSMLYKAEYILRKRIKENSNGC